MWCGGSTRRKRARCRSFSNKWGYPKRWTRPAPRGVAYERTRSSVYTTAETILAPFADGVDSPGTRQVRT